MICNRRNIIPLIFVQGSIASVGNYGRRGVGIDLDLKITVRVLLDGYPRERIPFTEEHAIAFVALRFDDIERRASGELAHRGD